MIGKKVILLLWLILFASSEMVCAKGLDLEDGTYEISVLVEGGSGRASVTSPASLRVKDQQAKLLLEWSSSNYDYMKVGDEIYYPVDTQGNSTFEIPVSSLSEPMTVVADTVAMSTPHEITYTLYMEETSIQKVNATGQTLFLYIGAALIILLGISVFLWCKKKKMVLVVFWLGVTILTGAFFLLRRDFSLEKNNSEEVVIPKEIGLDLSLQSQEEMQYATGFSIYEYMDEEGRKYKLICTGQEQMFLVVPEEGTVPENLSEDIVVIENPENIYLVASSVMDMMVHMDALEQIQFSGIKAGDWLIEDAKEQMESGNILYAGKYSAPDYELLLQENCDLVIENNMIYHTPEVKEKLESFGIPVIVDSSSYETTSLGRAEWIKVYGALLGREEEANEAFEQQVEMYQKVQTVSRDEKQPTVAFFYLSSDGNVKVRQGNDYMVQMIQEAGGQSVFAENENGKQSASTMNMSMEDFYSKAMEADYIIYNCTVEGEIKNLDELLKKNNLLKDMKAVREGNVYGTSKGLYQNTMEPGSIIRELNQLLHPESASPKEDMEYFYKIQ